MAVTPLAQPEVADLLPAALLPWCTLGEQTPFAFAIAASTGHLLYANPHYIALTNRSPAALDGIAQPWLPLLHAEDRARLSAKASDPAQVLDDEVRFAPTAGEPRWLHLRRWPVTLPDQRQSYLILTLEDISQRKRAEAALRLSHATQHEFSERLARMSSTVLALTRAANLDELCRSAVELGIRELGFDRLGLWLISEEPGMMRGTYGTDERGQLRDERHYHVPIVQNDLLVRFLQQPEQRYAYLLGSLIRDVDLNPVGEGWHVVTGLWDGESIVGYLFADNLLHHLPYTDQEGELISLYASTLGHLCTHLRIEGTLENRHRAANVFLNKMATLSSVAAQLTRSPTLNELCRNAIILGRTELGFDRLGLWFTGDDSDLLRGTYGTDEQGNLRDEWGRVMSLEEDFPLRQALKSKERYAFQTGIIIPTLDGRPMSFGWKATAALWNGEKIIGYLFCDNLLQQQPYSEHEGELLALYALLLGHLCTRQQIEEDLREREASYRTLINAIPDYMFVVTREGLVLDYHEAHEPIPNLDVTSFVGKYIDELTSPAITQLCMLSIEDAFSTRRIASFEYPTPIAGRLHHFEARLTAGDNNKVVVLVRDVTDRKRLEEQLYASQKMESLGRMASGIAHDFNNLLTVIQGFTSVAESQLPENATRLHKVFTHIRSATEKGARLTNQLLLFARKKPVQPKVLNLNDLILGLKTILRTTLGEDIQLLLTLEPQLGYVEIDPGQFEQVLINLSVNARDAMPDGGTLMITTQQLLLDEQDSRRHFNLPAGLYDLVEISDTGVGIDPDLQKQIFEPFFTTKAPGKGTGLGLSICHSIIQQFGGQIVLKSIPGEGTTFRILLPPTSKTMDVAGASMVNQAAAQRVMAGAETILLVEDDLLVRAVAMEVLTSQGYRVLECASGPEALEVAKNDSYTINLLMTDMIMPHMHGSEVATRFMQLRPNVPTLLVSGYVAELPEALVNHPNVTFLAKPYTLHSLTSTVRVLLDQQRVC